MILELLLLSQLTIRGCDILQQQDWRQFLRFQIHYNNGVPEVGKLVPVWLQTLESAVWWLNIGPSIAVVVLMFITSIGIFGYLQSTY